MGQPDDQPRQENIPAATTIRLVVSDMDGTILNKEKILSEETLRAAQKLTAQGIKLCLVSSRFPPGMERFRRQMGLDTPLGALNGAEIVDSRGKILSSLTLAPETVQQACTLLRENGVDAWLYSQRDWFVTDKSAPHVQHESDVVGTPPQVVDDLSAHFHQVGKIQGVCDDAEKLAKLEREIGRTLGDAASVHRSSDYYLDITPQKANKGFALQFLAAHYGFSLEEVACIGDMSNDVPMLKLGQVSIAMGNARDDVKRHAKYVTASNAEEGWAKAMVQFVLPHAPATDINRKETP